MRNRQQFSIHTPVPPVAYKIINGSNPSFTAEINFLSFLSTFDTRAFQNIAGLSFVNKLTSMTITVTPEANFANCDRQFRSLLGRLNADNCGLSLRELDAIIIRFNDFLSRNNINSDFVKKAGQVAEYHQPGNNCAF